MRILLFLILTAMVCNGQTILQMRIEGKAELLTGEIIASENRDANGEVCAGLMIIHDLDGMSYDSYNKIVKVISKPGSDLLFLSPTEQVVTVYLSGFQPLKLLLNEQNIKLKSREVWQLKITGEKRVDLIAINIVPSESGAEILIDGKPKGSGKTHQVAVGKHEVVVSKNGFKTIVDTINVSANNILFNYALERVKSFIITIKSVPAGAAIRINGNDIGKRTNAQYSIVEGKHRLKLQKYGFSDVECEIEVKEGGKTEFSYPMTKSITTLKINFTPPDAELILDGEIIKGDVMEIKPGEHTVEVRKDNYVSVYETIKIAAGEKAEKNYAIYKNTAQVCLTVTPADADIEINSQKYVNTKTIELPEGSYFIEIKKEGYATYSETVQLKKDERFERTLKLEPAYGSLQFIVQPIEANVKLLKNNILIRKWQGSTIIDSLPTGSYTIEAGYQGYVKGSRNISIAANSVANEEVLLTKDMSRRVKIDTVVQEGSLAKNISFESDGDVYTITYDLEGDADAEYEIELYLLGKAATGLEKKLQNVGGHIGRGKFAGKDRTITWAAIAEFPNGINKDSFYLKLTSEKIGGGIPWYVWTGTAIAGGVAAIIITNKKADAGNATPIPGPPIRPGN